MNVSRHHVMGRLMVITAVFLTIILAQIRAQADGRIAVALAKSNQMLTMGSMPSLILNRAELPPNLPPAQFVQAVRLGQSEALPWNCPAYQCALATFYDLARGVTINQVIDLHSDTAVATWEDPYARPPGTAHILPLALKIAAADAQVQATLGDIGMATPVMIPMSGWLADDDCRQDWCVDLTFEAPQGDGRVYHVFINLEKGQVARTFYTRGRPDLDVALPSSQRSAFGNGCHEQAGWSICWEMTADDGVNFTEATFKGAPVFASAKIGQIEAWYPSWPGGYRDEIGFNASVRPFGGTEVVDVDRGNGFEVRQMFTEFTRWPNCICCYRYEQIVRVFADGVFEFDFVSHGPGCDDLSVYRPFWRIDLANTNEAWVWQETAWVSADVEQELHPFVTDLSPDGYKLTTRNSEQLYQWALVPTDPLDLDEAYVFLLQAHENEGDGPILTGPGDTFQPPRQWLNGDRLSGEQIILWYVPLLKTKKGGPWWCMPDPEPGINQCNAILRAAPVEALHQPTAEELAQLPAPTATTPPVATDMPAPTPTPRPIQGDTAEEIILNSGCGACHSIGALGEKGKVGPDLSDIGAVAGERVPDLSATAYLRQSILEPNVFIAPECPNGACLANIMPTDYASRLTASQIDIMIAFLLTQIEPIPEPLMTIGGDAVLPTAVPKTDPLAKSPNSLTAAGQDANYAIQFLLLGMVFMLTLFLLRQRPSDQ